MSESAVSLSMRIVPLSRSDFKIGLGATPAARAFVRRVDPRDRPGFDGLIADMQRHELFAPIRPGAEIRVERDARKFALEVQRIISWDRPDRAGRSRRSGKCRPWRFHSRGFHARHRSHLVAGGGDFAGVGPSLARPDGSRLPIFERANAFAKRLALGLRVSALRAPRQFRKQFALLGVEVGARLVPAVKGESEAPPRLADRHPEDRPLESGRKRRVARVGGFLFKRERLPAGPGRKKRLMLLLRISEFYVSAK